jgi:signal transduction histidine kinase
MPRKRARRRKIKVACFIAAGLLVWSARESPGTTNDLPPAVQFTSLLVDGHERWSTSRLPAAPGSPKAGAEPPGKSLVDIRIPTGHQELKFTFGPSPAASQQPIRLRYRLEGYETNWHDTGDPMRFVVHFRDSQDVPVGSADFPVHGDSPGWTGTIGTSPFVERRQTVIAPERCRNARIWIPSGGNPDTVGIYVIDDLKVTDLGETGQGSQVLLFDDFESGRDLDSPLGDLDGWVRDGTSLSIAQIVKTGHGSHNHALAVIDDSPDKFGAWDADEKKLLPVMAGDKLLLEWKEMYSVGGCRSETVDYHDLPAGEYRFVVCVASVFGVATGEEAAVAFRVVPPFYSQGWFHGLSLLLGIGLLIGSVRYATWRRFKKRLERLNLQQLVEHERTRIAQDIHDDLGTRLTRISLLSQAVRRDAQNSPHLAPGLDEIYSTVREMTQALDEIVWAVDPQQDSLDSLVSYLAASAQDLLAVAGIKCRFSFPVELPPLTLFPDVRHNLFLAFSEVLNNAIKHAGATEINIGLELGSGHFVLWVHDNGTGFDQTTPPGKNRDAAPTKLPGSGLANLKTRLQKINGELKIESRPGQGTKVIFTVPLQSSRAAIGRSWD